MPASISPAQGKTFTPRSLGLPVFPWDLLAPYRRLAAGHPQGMVDLSVGTPVDPTPEPVQRALAAAANAPGYPTVVGELRVREAIASWARRVRSSVVVGPHNCFPTVGSKELIANLGWQLGLGPGDKVLFPECAYPTYEICALTCGAEPVPVSRDVSTWPRDAKLVWINTPGNPDGWVASEEYLREVVAFARATGALVASDECYAPLTYTAPYAGASTPSLLSSAVCGDDPRGLLLVYSLSKQSNLAGYRAAFVAGDEQVISQLVEVRKHCGFIVPSPVQAALEAALGDEETVCAQVKAYAERRKVLRAALEVAGLSVSPVCEAGLYLWVSDEGKGGESLFARVNARADVCSALPLQAGERLQEGKDWQLVHALAALGICSAPASFYEPETGPRVHVRIALSASDERIAAAARRLREWA